MIEKATHQYEQGSDVEQNLELMRQGLTAADFSGYPSQERRLFGDPDLFERNDKDRLVIPAGSWEVNIHFDRPDTELTPTPVQQEHLSGMGLELDSLGRPLHPWFRAMMRDPAIGVITGKGCAWRWGPSRTADSIVIQNDRMLLVRRKDTDEWALPGGFCGPDETDLASGVRELAEETDVVLPERVVTGAEEIYSGEVADIRIAQGWPRTAAFLFRVAGNIYLNSPKGKDDAKEAAWVGLDTVQDPHSRLFGAHSLLVQKALAVL